MGKKKDKYSNFSELQARERKDIDFRITTYFHNPLTTAVVAPHGGAIEPGTSELALAIASIDLNPEFPNYCNEAGGLTPSLV